MEIPHSTSADEPANSEDLVGNYRRLRSLCHSISIALLILTGVVFVFIYRQVVVIRQQADQLFQEVAEFEQSGAPAAIDELRRQLYLFSQEDPNFRPLYVRYFGTNQPPPAGPAVAPALEIPGQ